MNLSINLVLETRLRYTILCKVQLRTSDICSQEFLIRIYAQVPSSGHNRLPNVEY